MGGKQPGQTEIAAIRELISQRKLDEAEHALLSLDASGEATAESQYLLGTILHRKNRLMDAVNAFKRSLLLDPQFIDSAISLSVIYNDTGHYQEAREIFEKAESCLQEQNSASNSVLLDRELAAKHIDLGNMYRKLQRFDSAANEYMKATRLDPKNLEARINLAKTLAQRGQTKLAHRELTNIIEEHPNYIPARIHLALLYYAIGNTVDARMELAQARQRDPKNEAVKMYLALTEKATESVLPEAST